MKKLTILLVLLFVFLTSFSQTKITNDEINWLRGNQNYNSYVDFCGKHNLLARGELMWILSGENGTGVNNRIFKQEMLRPGDYLIKAKKQMFYGVSCQAVSALILVVSSNNYDKNKSTFNSMNSVYIGTGVLAILGLGFELSGFSNMGKAGLALNENGIGINIKF